MTHYHLTWTRCVDPSCRDQGKEGLLSGGYILFGAITGCSELAAALMAHYEVNPDDHPDVRAEIEQAIGEELLDTGAAILREHGIAYPGFDPVVA